MSASLVGSEMCIRDRARRPSTGAPPPGTAPEGNHRSAVAAASQGPEGGAVSYTHLTLPTICSV
eukprot:256894-Alexandrium_andersonii.AAC.1